MIKLYKRDDTGRPVAYHEAWIDPPHRRIVEHWGLLGEHGETDSHRIHIFGSLERQFARLLDPARELGFEELDESDFATLLLSYDRQNLSPDEIEDLSEDLQDALTEKLGWTGLGHCVSADQVEATLLVRCKVVDIRMAQMILAEALDQTEFGTYSRMQQE